MRALARCALILALGACGGGGVDVEVTLVPPTKDVLSPYDPSARMTFVRVNINGTSEDLSSRLDEVSKDLDLSARKTTFEGFPEKRPARVQALGFDALGNLVAYGHVDTEIDGDDLSVNIAFRRTLAYVTHREICDGGCGPDLVCANPGDGHRCVTPATAGACGASCDAGQREVCALPSATSGPACMRPFGGSARGSHVIYAIDINSKTLVDVVTLPAADLKAVNITAKSGEGMWVTFAGPAKSSAAFLSSADNTWGTPIDLHLGAEFTVGDVGTKYVVAAGGGSVAIFDETTRTEVRKVPLGGRILDGLIGGGATSSVLVTSAGLAKLDLEAPEEANPVSPGDVTGASGIARSDDGIFAYVASGGDGRVQIFDLLRGNSRRLDNPFLAPVRGLVFSEHAQVVLGIQVSTPSQRVFSYSISEEQSFPIDRGIAILPEAQSIAAGPLGRRVVVVSAGTSTGSAGLTVIDPVPNEQPTGSTVLYLRDPTDSYLEGRVSSFQRYRPDKVAILYGQ